MRLPSDRQVIYCPKNTPPGRQSNKRRVGGRPAGNTIVPCREPQMDRSSGPDQANSAILAGGELFDDKRMGEEEHEAPLCV